MIESPTDDQGLQYLFCKVEDELGKADDVIAGFEQMVARAATMIPAGGIARNSNGISAPCVSRLSTWS